MHRPPAVARVLERVTATIREHGMVLPGDTVLACVSGGPDSVCLLYSLWHLRRLLKLRIEVFHFDHRLRADSGTDVAYVRRLADRLRVPFHLEAATEGPGRGDSVEAWAAMARLRAANEVRRASGSTVVAEGHTLDDQVETVLLNLIRGAGLEGMSGILPGTRDAAWIQPLIEIERAEVEAFCRALHLRPRADPMNRDPRYLRNAIRLSVIPAIEGATGREVKRPMARTADLLRADREGLDAQAVRAMRDIVSGSPDDLRFDAAALRSLPRTISSRVVRLALYRILSGDDVLAWTRDAVDGVLDLAAGRRGRRRDLPNGLKARRDAEYVSVSRASPESRV